MRPNPNTTQLEDKKIASDVLGTTKFIADAYAKYAIDSATPAIRQTFASLYMESLTENERVFRIMEGRGWYSVTKADQQQISQIQSKFGGSVNQQVYTGQTGTTMGTMGNMGPTTYGGGSYGRY